MPRPNAPLFKKGGIAFHLLCAVPHNKWNKIEHRMFCHITQNWRGRPLVCREVIVNLIGAVTTKEGLRIESALDENHYELGRKVTDAELKRLSIERAEFHGEWDYTIGPRPLNEEVI